MGGRELKKSRAISFANRLLSPFVYQHKKTSWSYMQQRSHSLSKFGNSHLKKGVHSHNGVVITCLMINGQSQRYVGKIIHVDAPFTPPNSAN